MPTSSEPRHVHVDWLWAAFGLAAIAAALLGVTVGLWADLSRCVGSLETCVAVERATDDAPAPRRPARGALQAANVITPDHDSEAPGLAEWMFDCGDDCAAWTIEPASAFYGLHVEGEDLAAQARAVCEGAERCCLIRWVVDGEERACVSPERFAELLEQEARR